MLEDILFTIGLALIGAAVVIVTILGFIYMAAK